MLTELSDNRELQETLSCLKQDVQNCLYIYIDLARYGLDNPNMKIWIDKVDQSINLVVMKYHDGFQIYGRHDAWEQEELLALIREYEPERISGNEPVIRGLEERLSQTYQATYGAILKRSKNIPFDTVQARRCELAGPDDMPEIADLMLTEEEFGQAYEKEELVEQLKERQKTGMGRSLIIRDKGRIVGHVATFAEAEDVAVMSGSVIQKEYRSTGYYDILCSEFYSMLLNEEKKDLYFFLTNKRHITLYSRLFQKETTYGKLIKIT